MSNPPNCKPLQADEDEEHLWWMGLRQALLSIVDLIERYKLHEPTRTAELRKMVKRMGQTDKSTKI